MKERARFAAANQARAICKGVPESKGRGQDRQERAECEATVSRNASVPFGAIARLFTGVRPWRSRAQAFDRLSRIQTNEWVALGITTDAISTSRLPGQLIKNICSPTRRPPFRKPRKFRSTPRFYRLRSF